MAETLAVAGSILLLLAVTGGIEGIGTKFFQKDQFVPVGDRIAAILGRVLQRPAVRAFLGEES